MVTLQGSRMSRLSGMAAIGMCLAALVLVLGHAVVFGIVHDQDEGAAAHVFQLLMVGQVPVLAWLVHAAAARRERTARRFLGVLAALWASVLGSVAALT